MRRAPNLGEEGSMFGASPETTTVRERRHFTESSPTAAIISRRRRGIEETLVEEVAHVRGDHPLVSRAAQVP